MSFISQMDRTEIVENNFVLYIVALLVNVNFLTGGITVGWPQSVLPQLLSTNSSIPLTDDEGAWVAGVNNAGIIVGGIITIFVASRYGIKRTLLLGSLPAVSGWIIIAIASTYWKEWRFTGFLMLKRSGLGHYLDILGGSVTHELIVGRFILGVFCGMCCDLSESYIAELSPSKIRGRLCASCNISVHLGILLAFSIGSLSITLTSIIYVTIFVGYLVVFAFFAPETPYWYARQGNHEKTKKCLKLLRRTENIEREYEEIVQFVKAHSNSSYVNGENLWTKARRTLKRIETRRALIVVVLLTSGQQFSGIQAINVYAEVLFAKSVKVLPAKYVSILIGLCELFFTSVGMVLVDTFGRRFLFTSSGLASASLMCLTGIYFHLESIGTCMDDLEYLAIAGILLFAMSYSVGLSCVASVVASEAFSSEMRVIGMSIKTLVFSTSALMTTKIWQVVASAFGDQYSFFTIAAITFLHVCVLYFIQPETKGKTLAEIQVIFSRPLWNPGDRHRDRRKIVTVCRNRR